MVPTLIIAVLMYFMLRETPFNLAEEGQEIYTFNVDKELKKFQFYYPISGEDFLLDKIIVNLKQTAKYTSAMGMFEIYLNVRSQAAVQQITDKEPYIQDEVQRELERFTYEKLSSPSGKKLARIVLKNIINDYFDDKVVKKLYFKTFVIQPRWYSWKNSQHYKILDLLLISFISIL